MENENRNRSRYLSDENWDQNQGYGNVNDSNQYNRQNRPDQRNQQSYMNQGQGYNAGYGRNEEDNYSGGQSSGNAGIYGRSSYGQQGGYNQGGYGQGNYNQGSSYGNSHNDNYGRRDGNWNSQQQQSSGTQYNRMEDRETGEGFRSGYGSGSGYQRQNMNERNSETRNRYGGDTSNYGNANQGGWDRSWWDRAKDEVSSWFGDDDNDRRNRDRNASGPHRGKGPKGYKRSDERIREDVCDRLCDHPMIDASNIDIKVEGSEVILTGTVESREDKRRAEDLAESISGVSNVQNQLRVSHRDSNSSGSGGRSDSHDRHRNDAVI